MHISKCAVIMVDVLQSNAQWPIENKCIFRACELNDIDGYVGRSMVVDGDR